MKRLMLAVSALLMGMLVLVPTPAQAKDAAFCVQKARFDMVQPNDTKDHVDHDLFYASPTGTQPGVILDRIPGGGPGGTDLLIKGYNNCTYTKHGIIEFQKNSSQTVWRVYGDPVWGYPDPVCNPGHGQPPDCTKKRVGASMVNVDGDYTITVCGPNGTCGARQQSPNLIDCEGTPGDKVAVMAVGDTVHLVHGLEGHYTVTSVTTTGPAQVGSDEVVLRLSPQFAKTWIFVLLSPATD